jgi:uncharacterized protein (DUF427 family)
MSQTRPHAHRIEIAPTDEHLRIVRDGVELAGTHGAVVLREGSLPPRYYIPREDVRMELLTPTDSSSHCPFKGDARYWSFGDMPDVAWSYEQPIPGAEPIAGLICFYNERVDIEIDGTTLERPETRWS